MHSSRWTDCESFGGESFASSADTSVDMLKALYVAAELAIVVERNQVRVETRGERLLT